MSPLFPNKHYKDEQKQKQKLYTQKERLWKMYYTVIYLLFLYLQQTIILIARNSLVNGNIVWIIWEP